MCDVLDALEAVSGRVPDLPMPVGLGASAVLAEQVKALTGSLVLLQRELAARMAQLEQQSPDPLDVAGDAVRAGMATPQARRLRQLGVFARTHDPVRQAWAGGLGADQVGALRDGAHKVGPRLAEELIDVVLPALEGLDGKLARRLVAHAVEELTPHDQEAGEQGDYAARYLSWTGIGGALSFQGHLPAPEAALFKAAIKALAEDLRVAGDGVGPAQRRADALIALVAKAAVHGLPTGGGQPVAVTLTVPVSEAGRIAGSDPTAYGTRYEDTAPGGSTIDGHPAGDAAVRFGMCCAAVTPVLHETPAPGSLLARIGAAPIVALAVGRSRRLATRAQRTALALRDGGCVIPGCQVAAAYTEPHHVTPWAMEGSTDLHNLVSLCFVHHRQTELGRWKFHTKDDARPEGAYEHAHWWITPPA